MHFRSEPALEDPDKWLQQTFLKNKNKSRGWQAFLDCYAEHILIRYGHLTRSNIPETKTIKSARFSNAGKGEMKSKIIENRHYKYEIQIQI
jgi:hypothetical protein